MRVNFSITLIWLSRETGDGLVRFTQIQLFREMQVNVLILDLLEFEKLDFIKTTLRLQNATRTYGEQDA